jgi:hypothetical protein
MEPKRKYAMMFFMTASLALLCAFLTAGCVGSDIQGGTLKGTVIFWQGDFLPGSPTGTKTPVIREVLIYEPTTRNEVTVLDDPPFYSDIQTQRVATTVSDANGHFRIYLQAGRYSLFVKENDLYYSNRFDSDSVINPATIVSGATTTIIIDITYQATF